jgi:hypothetical protein
MTYDEVGSGGLEAGGCVITSALHPQITAFGVGDTLYSMTKARRGVLEKVVIKSVRSILNKRTLAVRTTLYVDTLNALWNEWDLVPYGTALTLAEEHRMKVQDAQNRLRCR